MSALGFPGKGCSHPLERWGRAVAVLPSLVFVYLLRDCARHPEDVVRLGVQASLMAISVAGVLMLLAGRRRGAREVLGRGGRLCPRCRYPLSHLEHMGMCPECGDPFTHEDNVAAWRARYPWLRL